MLNKNEIEKLIKDAKLVEGYIKLETQLTPNGFDLTAGSVYEFTGQGQLDFSNNERVLPPEKELVPFKKRLDDKFGWWDLRPGIYKIKTNETVIIPNDMTAIAFPRSSLLRMGAFVQNGVWDAGFRGKSEFVLVVMNTHGIRLKQNARVIQMLFTSINEVEEGYRGVYQGKT